MRLPSSSWLDVCMTAVSLVIWTLTYLSSHLTHQSVEVKKLHGVRFHRCHRTVFCFRIVKRLIGLRPVIFTNPQNLSTNGHKLKLPSNSLPAGGKSSLSGATGITVARECAAVELPTLAEHPIINNEYDRHYFS